MKGLDGDKEHFTTLWCRMYTFLIIQDARRFFATELIMEDFEEDAIDNVVFPTSLLDLTAQSLALRQDLTVTNFPPKWNIGRVTGGGMVIVVTMEETMEGLTKVGGVILACFYPRLGG